MLILDHTKDARRYSPLVYDEKVIKHYKNLKRGSLAYDDFWDEQDELCLEGFKPKGMDPIVGEHYFALNMCKIEMLPIGAKRKRPHEPYFRDLDQRLYTETSEAKKHKYGLIVGKPRRVGLSWFGAIQIAHELLMNYHNRVGICAGKQDKADAFYAKVMYLLHHIRDEYKVARLKKDDKILKLGYLDLINKQKEESGLLSEMLIRTMFVDSAGFEGESLTLAIFEEAGLFQNLISSYKSTEPCFREGANQFGTPLIYGTGGEIDKGARGYMEMWNKSHTYNLKKIFIPADEYYPGEGELDKVTNKKISFFDITTGKTNREAARKYILQERELASKSKDGYIKHIQNYPLKESEIFIKTTGGILDRAALNAQLIKWSEGKCPLDHRTGRLEWVDDEMTAKLVSRCKDAKSAVKIRIERGSTVKWVDDVRGTIQKVADPINRDNMDHKPDIAGCDSYDDEIEEGTGSIGATLVYRTYAGPSKLYNYPIAVLAERGDATTDDTFYENNVKLAVYYNYELLFEYSKIAIQNYFIDVGATKYLKERPDLRKELGPTSSKNRFGVRMPKEAKSLVTKLLKAEVKNNIHNCWFENVILDLMDYGDKNTDIAMAYGVCMLFKLELFDEILDEYDVEDYGEMNMLDDMMHYDIDIHGNVKIKTYSGVEIDQFETFNPESDLSEYDKKEFIRQKELYREEQIRSFGDMTEINKNIQRKIVEDEIRKNIFDDLND